MSLRLLGWDGFCTLMKPCDEWFECSVCRPAVNRFNVVCWKRFKHVINCCCAKKNHFWVFKKSRIVMEQKAFRFLYRFRRMQKFVQVIVSICNGESMRCRQW